MHGLLLAVVLLKTVVSLEEVRTGCHGRVETACTNFEAAKFSFTCSQTSKGWTPRVLISARAHMVLSHRKFQLHELSHVFDFEYDMRHHAAAIESQSFESHDACMAFGSTQQEAFPANLQEYVRSSMLRRDGVALPNRQ